MLAGQKFGKYEIDTKIGEGGMGEVYSAYDSDLGRNVAIKILPSEFSNDVDRKLRFRREARAVSALNHPNILTIYEIGENERCSFLATELVEGRTLRDLIRAGSVTMVQALRLIEQAANALVEAHHAQIVHRDIKPENIMVREDNIVKVLDFGLAKPPAELSSSALGNDNVKTIAGIILGSARYMSPEQARGKNVDERTDIWSLGVVLYELLTGQAPFNGETPSDTIAAVVYKDPEPLAKYIDNAPPELYRIVRKALQKDREERYQDVKDLALDLKDLIYELEHSNSSDRHWQFPSHLDISENPTMIHTTISGNQPTAIMASPTTDVTLISAAPVSRRRLPFYALFGVAALLIAVLGLSAFIWLDSPRTMVVRAFDSSRILRVSTDGKVSLPAISPDGKYLAYVSGEIGNLSLIVRQISTDSTVTVVPPSKLNFSAVTFSPNGDRIFYCQMNSDLAVGTLFSVPTLGGTPKKLIEDIDSAVTFSPDGKRFAFLRHVVDRNEDLLMTADAETLEVQELLRSKTAGYDFFSPRPAWSPEGDRILIGAGNRDGGPAEKMVIAVIDVNGPSLTVIDKGSFLSVGHFAWFADGSGFLFSARETQTGPIQVWRSSYPELSFHQVTNDFNDYAELGLSVDGKTVVTMKGETSSSLWRYTPTTKDSTQLTTESRSLSGFAGISQFPDGSLIYTSKEGKDSDLWRSDADGKDTKQLLQQETGSFLTPTVSPDGKQIVFVKQTQKQSRIWRSNADGTGAIQLSADDPDFVDFDPQFTPDGGMVIFQRFSVATDKSSMMKMPSTGGTPEVLYENNKWMMLQPRVSPDGKHIAFIAFDLATFEKHLEIASLNDSQFGVVERELEYKLVNRYTWAPNSKELTLLTTMGGTPNLWRQPIDGSPATPLTNFGSGRIFNFTWTTDGKSLILARGNTVNDLLLIRDNSVEADSDVTRAYRPERRRNYNPFSFVFGNSN